jgi:ATP-dependent exoDNAse (exonuclease V) alpha subunit
MTQDQALDILKTGANVFLTGEPGAGKTHTVNAYVDYLRRCDVEPAITASTGIAATHIGGMTIHSWSGIGIKTHLDKYDLDKIATSEYICKRVNKTKVLIIDEISMLSTNMLDMVDMVCREIKQNPEPFGGMQIILVGDFFQLPPIIKRNFEEKKDLFGSSKEKNNKIFAYSAGAWERTRPVVCYLSEQHRQDDKNFLSLLSAIRVDDVKEEHLKHIRERQIDHDDMPENITKLFSHNLNVDSVNTAELSKIEEDTKVFHMTSEGNDKLVETMKKGCLSPEKLELKVGAVVMCTKNNQKEHFVNGTLGVVVGFDEFSGNPIIKNQNGRRITTLPMDWTVEENGKIRAQITQVPLRLAWAMTVHKSQGMSLDAAVMDLSQVFEFGQGYVALSRVRRLSGLYLLGINEHALKVHPEILKKDIDFKKSSADAVGVFGKLTDAEIKKMHDDFVKACEGKVSTPSRVTEPPLKRGINAFAEIREKHPNAYRPWSKDQDQELTALFSLGVSVQELMKKFGRKKGAISSRLDKLGLR